MVVLLIVVLLTLTVLAFQDFKDREVSWFLFPILGIVGVSFRFLLTDQWIDGLVGIGLIVFVFLGLTIYYSIKNGSLHMIFDKELGLGDVLFLLLLPLFMGSVFVLAFFVASSVLAIVVYLLFLSSKKSTIPLAGIQAVLLGVMLVSATITRFSLYDNSTILTVLVHG